MAAFEGLELYQAFGHTLQAEDQRGTGHTVAALAARGLTQTKSSEARSAWCTGTPLKHAYYLNRIRYDPMLEMLRS